MKDLRDDPERGMLCIDWNDPELPIKVFGDHANNNYQRFEAALLPCNYVNTFFGHSGDTIHPECVYNLEEQIEYMGAVHWLMLINEERVNPEGYDEEAIERFSIIYNQ